MPKDQTPRENTSSGRNQFDVGQSRGAARVAKALGNKERDNNPKMSWQGSGMKRAKARG